MEIKDILGFETHSHSMYSNIRLLDCINRPKDMLLTVNSLGLKGMVITDHEALCSHVEFLQLEKELKEKEKLPQDFKLGLGNEIYLTDTRDKKQKYYHFILIAKDTEGHRALRELSSKAWYYSYYYNGMERVPTKKSELEDIINKYPNKLIGTTACLGGELATDVMNLITAEKNNIQEQIIEAKTKIVDFLKFGIDLFGDDFYIEVAPSRSPDQILFNRRVKSIAAALNIKMIYATDAHYLTEKDRFAHKMYLNSKDGDREVDAFYSYAHFMSVEEAYNNLKDIFTLEEFAQMCRNSLGIMNKIGTYEIFHNPIIPEVGVVDFKPVADESLKDYPTIYSLRAEGNRQERYWVNTCLTELKNKGLDNKPNYMERLEIEASVIKTIGNKLGNCLFEYFNTFQHFIDLFWECGSLSGPGRGSSVCFLSNYLLGITQLDPIVYDLQYWRFLNNERIELPDIDTDLTPSKRSLIFKRIREERGELNLIQVATFSTEGTRSAILSSCRGYRSKEYPDGIDSDIGQYLTGMIPEERGFLWSLEEVIYGDESKDRKPIKTFIDEVNKYPGLLQIMLAIEGLVCNRGQHASGVILYNDGPFETNAIMRSPNGDLTTQFALHQSEALGDTKFDFLVTEVCDKITTAINLLKDDGYFKDTITLRETYEKYFHPSVIDVTDNRIWDALAAGTVMDVFQFNSSVGLQSAKAIKPTTPIQMTMANALMRLMGEKGAERPLDRYVRLKNNMNAWYAEVQERHFTKEEIAVLEKYYLPRCGVPATQEDLMMVCMDKDIAGFTLKEANAARKTVAKKKMSEIPTLKEKFVSGCKNRELGEYVWETTMGPQMGYSFALPHALAYSFVGIQTLMLATMYPPIYWNCACLIVNSGGTEDTEEEEEEIVSIFEPEDYDEYEYEDLPDRSGKKKKQKSTKYGKISAAIGTIQKTGTIVAPPHINKSRFTFTPDIETNTIIYGIKGITRIGSDIIDMIMANRPFTSLKDFLSKVKVNKLQTINLIKSGAFDCFGDRTKIMEEYIDSISDYKQRLTIANVPKLSAAGLIPASLLPVLNIYNFNKELKKSVSPLPGSYCLKDTFYSFYERNFDMDNVFYRDNVAYIICTTWDNTYKKQMDPMRKFIKENCTQLLNDLNKQEFNNTWDKYCGGTLSKWEMDSIGFYYHEHELAKMDDEAYNIVDFSRQPSEPEVARQFYKDGKPILLYNIVSLAGTVLDKNKSKSQITLLTKYGVVVVKVYKAQFVQFDKQLSERQSDGTKKIIEKSWFSRGRLLYVSGFRRGDEFQLKKYKNSPHEVIELITDIDEQGFIQTRKTRLEVSECS